MTFAMTKWSLPTITIQISTVKKFYILLYHSLQVIMWHVRDFPFRVDQSKANCIILCNQYIAGLSECSTSSTISDHELLRQVSDYAAENGLNPKPKIKPKMNIITPEVVAALDRTNISSRKASYIFAPLIRALRLDLEDYNISHSAIEQNRKKNRPEMVKELKHNLTVAENLTIHWDSKLVKDIVGHENVERLAILVTGQDTEQLLAIPKLPSGTGECSAEAVVETLKKWNLADHVRGLCFDTPAANTGNDTQGDCKNSIHYLGTRFKNTCT